MQDKFSLKYACLTPVSFPTEKYRITQKTRVKRSNRTAAIACRYKYEVPGLHTSEHPTDSGRHWEKKDEVELWRQQLGTTLGLRETDDLWERRLS